MSKDAIPVKETGPRHYGRHHKYMAVRTTVDGHNFPSKREAQRYQELLILKKAGEIHGEIDLQPVFPIVINGHHVCKVILDFSYRDAMGRRHYEDVKGFFTPMSKLKHKLLFAAHGITVEVVR